MKTLVGAEHLEKLRAAETVAFDCETLQLKPEMGKLRLLQFAAGDTIVVVDLFNCTESDLFAVGKFFMSDRIWIAHNAVFDLGWCQEYGWEPSGIVHCTMIMNRLVSNGKKTKFGNKLAEVCEKWLGVQLDKTEQTSDWGGTLTRSQLEYAAEDAAVLLWLHKKLSAEIKRLHLESALAVECKALFALAQMQRVGVPWSKLGLETARKNYQYDMEKAKADFILQFDEALPEGHKLPRDEDGSFNLRAKKSGTKQKSQKLIDRYGVFKPAGFNIGSPAQLLEKFTALMGKAPYDEKNKRKSVSKGALQKYSADYPCITTYLEWKRLTKREQMVGSMLEKMDDDGFIRAGYMQCGAETLRMTSMGPNMQQIPRDEDFRACAKAPKGWVFLDADYSQAELRLAAKVSQDQTMIDSYIEGKDLHDLTAEAIGCSRQVAKSANFGLLYGSGANGLRNYAVGMGVQLSLDEATEVRSKWLKTFNGIAKWQQALSDLADSTNDGTLAFTRIPVTNAIRYLPDEMNKLTVRANTPVQGAGAAMLKIALGNLWRHLKEYKGKVSLAACIHDEILLLCREEIAERFSKILQREMEFAGRIFMEEVPCIAEVKIGRTWAEAH